MTVVTRTFDTSKSINDQRSIQNVFTYLITEIGELAMEVSIDTGFAQRQPDEDGIVGEAVDVVICALDIIHLALPDITEQELEQLFQRKLDKWKTTSGN
jgi:NTP pyrophosphatase (non-canonical NTP hydrolase)